MNEFGQTWQKFNTSKNHLTSFAKYSKGIGEFHYDDINEEQQVISKNVLILLPYDVGLETSKQRTKTSQPS